MPSTKYTHLHNKLLTWWRHQGRVLPWRTKIGGMGGEVSQKTAKLNHDNPAQLREAAFQTYFASSLKRDPYRVIVAELMLQQTQVERVLPKYEAWMKKWPRINDLASASLSEILIFWQGLGYNRRARFLWLLAKEIAEKRQGVWPTTEEELRTLPGIGKYTARAVQSFALEQQVGVVDTNVKRIFERIFASEFTPEKAPAEKKYFAFADEVLPPGQADPWNQALMDFGATVCTARAPKCPECPVFDLCEANLAAIKQGYAHYADFLQKQLLEMKLTKKQKATPSVKFHESDRYFRGRMMDELRLGSVTRTQLRQRMTEQYGLQEDGRFTKLLGLLEKEGLVRIVNETVQLGEQ